MFFANRNTQKNKQLLDKIHTVFTAALTSRVASLFAGSARSGRVVLENSRIALPSYSQRALDLGRVLLLLTALPLEYYIQICIVMLELNQHKIECLEVVVLYFLIVDSMRNNVRGVCCEK